MRKEINEYRILCESQNCEYLKAREYFRFNNESDRVVLGRIVYCMQYDFEQIVDSIEMNKDEDYE
jgi:hypothetical protein